MGFREDIDTIIESVPAGRQMALFSATMPKAILDISKKYLKDPVRIKIKDTSASLPKIEERYFEVKNGSKDELLARLIRLESPVRALVFCNTKARTDLVAAALQNEGINAECIHGDITQAMRTDIMRRFKKGMFDILVATDVAARGIDVDDLDIVFNYDIPADREYYIHRIGRTARAGREGRSYTFVSGAEQMKELNDIMRFTGTVIKKGKNPTNEDIDLLKIKALLEKAAEHIGRGGQDNCRRYIEDVFGKRYTGMEVACALLQAAVGDPAGRREEEPDKDTSRYHLNLGRKDGLDRDEILDLLTRDDRIGRGDICRLDIHKTCSFINIPGRMGRMVSDSLKNVYHNGRKVKIEPASEK
jgi:ATP-dependent RNA helicase DeaD